jgi:hypothetical protein
VKICGNDKIYLVKERGGDTREDLVKEREVRGGNDSVDLEKEIGTRYVTRNVTPYIKYMGYDDDTHENTVVVNFH